TVANPSVQFTSTTTANLRADVKDDDGKRNMKLATLTLPTPQAKDGSTTFTNAVATFTSAGKAVFQDEYDFADPVTFTVGSGSGEPDVTIPDSDSTPKPGTNPSKPGKDTPPANDSGRTGITGSLSWGVDADFRDYITNRGAKGTISVQGARA